MGDLQVLDAETARTVERVCDSIVPGSARVGPAVYVDAQRRAFAAKGEPFNLQAIQPPLQKAAAVEPAAATK